MNNKKQAIILDKNRILRLRTIDRCLQRQNRRPLRELWAACVDALIAQNEDYENLLPDEILTKRTTIRDLEFLVDHFGAPLKHENKLYFYDDAKFTLHRRALPQSDVERMEDAIDLISNYGGWLNSEAASHIVWLKDSICTLGNSKKKKVVFYDSVSKHHLYFINAFYEYIRNEIPLSITINPPTNTAINPKDLLFRDEDETVLWRDNPQEQTNKITIASFSPYILKEHRGLWYAIGYDAKTKDLVSICLYDIKCIEPLSEKEYVYPEKVGFDAKNYLTDLLGTQRGLKTKPEEICIRVKPENVDSLGFKYPVEKNQCWRKFFKDGSMEVVFRSVVNEDLERYLLSYGDEIEVISPQPLRKKISATLSAAQKNYQKKGTKAVFIENDDFHLETDPKYIAKLKEEYEEKLYWDNYWYSRLTPEEREELKRAEDEANAWWREQLKKYSDKE